MNEDALVTKMRVWAQTVLEMRKLAATDPMSALVISGRVTDLETELLQQLVGETGLENIETLAPMPNVEDLIKTLMHTYPED